MTGRILPFPAASSASEYRFGRVVALLGMGALDSRTQLEQLRALAEREGMPLPKNPRFWRGIRQLGAASIGRKSVWNARAFDEWHETRGSNAAPVASPRGGRPAAAPGLREAMQRRARQLGKRA